MIVAEDFLDSAKSMLTGTVSEVVRRNCVSRAYYSAYHACSDFAEEMGIILVDGDYGAHAKLIRALKEDSRTHYIGVDLNTLKKMRVKADYLTAASVTLHDAKLSIRNAELLIRDINALAASSDALGTE